MEHRLPEGNRGVWEKGGASYFQNLRRIKLFVSRVQHSLERVGTEVNVQDFLKLELVRDIAPSIYDTIYRNPEYFYSDLAFEVRFTSKLFLDDKHAKQRRAQFFDEMIAARPGDKHDLAQVLEGLFPSFAEYRGKLGGRSVDGATAEKDKRIFHPRFFRQYFLLKVPSELFSQKEFNAFQSSIRSATEDEVKRKTSEMVRSLEQEDFKRWHFVHRIETVFEGFNATTKRGLCRGLVANSQLWSSDAFEFFDAVRCIRMALSDMKDSSDRQAFLMIVTAESTSTLCALLMVEMLQKEAPEVMPPDHRPIEMALAEKMRRHYLDSGAPSIFEEFSADAGKIEPIQLLFGWRRLGPRCRTRPGTISRRSFCQASSRYERAPKIHVQNRIHG